MGEFWDESTEKRGINADGVRVMRWVSSEMGAQRWEERKIKIISDWVRVRVSFEMRAQRGEERWDESTERRGDKIEKKLISGSEHSPKKLIIEFNFITELPLETSVYCLKSPSVTLQNILFKHEIFSNNF